MNKPHKSSRRDFLQKMAKSSAAAGLAAAFPTIVPSTVLGADAPSNKIILGNIGLGRRGYDLMMSILGMPDFQIAAIADVDRDFLMQRRGLLDDNYDVERKMIDKNTYAPIPPKAVEAYGDYRRLLERDDIDAVVIATPDHWHAKVSIDAMDAGKDVYCEKPLALTIDQGRAMVRAARKNGRVFQTGSQQRSDEKFRKACEYVRSGRLGDIEWVRVGLFHGPQEEKTPDEPVPPGLNWDMWLGATPYVPYNPRRCREKYRWYFDYSGGVLTDWGAHHCDIAQWGLGMDGNGPISVDGYGESTPGQFNTFVNFKFEFQYANGVKMSIVDEGGNGVTFHGPKGEIFVNRETLTSTPESILQEPLKDSDVHLYESANHMQNWVDCVKSRERPICDVEIGHRSATVCHLANICGRIGRSLKWNPETELFVDDDDANSWLSRPPRAPYTYF